MKGGVRVTRQGWAGRITLDRPRALNALTGPMVETISAALDEFAAAPSVSLVIIDSASPRVFSAGGDIAAVYRLALAGDFDRALTLCAAEYCLDAAIAAFPKPVITLVNGLAMGGGIGLSAHASHPVVTEHASLALPECSVGWVPDSGLTAILARAPGHLGEYLALTGVRIGAGDAIHAGFAAHFVPSVGLPALIDALAASGDTDAVDGFAAVPPQPDLAATAAEIDAAFGQENLPAMVEALETGPRESWMALALAKARLASPLSLSTALRLVRHARACPGLACAIEAEKTTIAHLMIHGDFLEGVRAAIIDRDRRPVWKYQRIEDLPGDTGALLTAPQAGTTSHFAIPRSPLLIRRCTECREH